METEQESVKKWSFPWVLVLTYLGYLVAWEWFTYEILKPKVGEVVFVSLQWPMAVLSFLGFFGMFICSIVGLHAKR